MSSSPIISIDWGTTQLRASLLSEQGAVLETRCTQEGIGAASIQGTSAAQLAQQLCDFLEEWLQQHPHARLIASGMVGSTEGLVSTEYLPCPVSSREMTRALVPHALPNGHTLHIVPGLICPTQTEGKGLPALMRGEETQIMGALDSLVDGSGLLVLPGTHSKWAWVEKGRVVRFRSFVTGELFAWLRDGSVLTRNRHAHEPARQTEDSAFVAGVREGIACRARGISLLESLFQLRLRIAQLGSSEREALAFGSGLLIGGEVAYATTANEPFPAVHLVGSSETTTRYQRAIDELGGEVSVEPEGAAERGHARLLAIAP